MISTERSYYENPELWLPERYTGANSERTERTINAIPQQISSILDAGCGNGVLTNRLEHISSVTGLDRSFSALQWVQRDKCQSDLAALPFCDNSFDLIISTEVLEHLPVEIYHQALDEIARVTKKYVLVSVPYCENLAIRMVTCPQCQFEFHRYYHMRSFGATELKRLFAPKYNLTLQNAWGIVEESLSGATRATQLRATVLQKLGLRKTSFSPSTVCPECAYTVEANQDTRPTQVVSTSANTASTSTQGPTVKRSKLYHAVDLIIPSAKSYRWWLALYRRS